MTGQRERHRGARALLTTAVAAALTVAGAVPALAVTGGADVAAGSLGFVAKLTIGTNERTCSGALINPQLVITAKSCFAAANGAVQSGPPAWETSATLGSTEVAVRDIIVHPDRDLALARLDQAVTSVVPVAIAATAPAADDAVTIAGFGRTATEWVPTTLKSAAAVVDSVGGATVDLVAAGGGSGGVCKGDAGGPALRSSGSSFQLIGVHSTSNLAGCLQETGSGPRATDTRVDDVGSWITANVPAFRSGFETGDARINWQSTVNTADGGGNATGIGGYCCGLTGAELKTSTERAHSGTTSLLYAGRDTSGTRSYAYLKAFGLRNVQVRPGSVLSYWIFPQSKANSSSQLADGNSTCVAVDVLFTDGSYSRGMALTDQRGNRLHPASQCDTLPLDTWTQVSVPLGTTAAGKTIDTVSVGYDQALNTGGYRGYLDDLQITDIVANRFASGLETGETALNWTNAVSTTVPGGGLANVGGYCCGLTGPETKLSSERGHTGAKSVLYDGRDTSSTSPSYAYLGMFAPADVYVTPNTRLSYWIFPQSKENSSSQLADGKNSSCVAVDLILLDNLDATRRSFRSYGAKDQRGTTVHPGGQCGNLTLDTWNYVSVPLGAANGRQVVQIDLGYDQLQNVGGYRGYVDDVRISD